MRRSTERRTLENRNAHDGWRRRPLTRQAMLRRLCRRLVNQGAQPVRQLTCLWSLPVARGVVRDAKADGLVWVIERPDGLWVIARGEGRKLGILALAA